MFNVFLGRYSLMMNSGIFDHDDSTNISSTPPEIVKIAETAMENSLPGKSRDLYNKAYQNFQRWRESKKAQSFSEKVLLAYFSEMAEKMQPSTLWSRYSMIKSVMKNQQNIDIANYHNLVSFLKRKSAGFHSKKSKILTSKDIQKFLSDAPDNQYLAIKVPIILETWIFEK